MTRTAIPLTDIEIGGNEPEIVDVLELETALDKLACLDPRQSRLVELRFFGGLKVSLTVPVTFMTLDGSRSSVRHGVFFR